MNNRVLVTGCCGTVGSELVKQLLLKEEYKDSEILGIDNNESKLFFQEQRYINNSNARFMLADIRDRDRIAELMKGIDVVFHAAALKHVVMCERSPMEPVQSNIIGVNNIIYAAGESGVSRVIFTSSDKAVNPTSVMGTSKLMGEKLITAANSETKIGTVFSSTRFGNVLGSSGSVIPIFRRQIESGGPVTITDKDMTRFVMSIGQAVRLVIDSVNLSKGGEVLITKMPVIRITDLAEVMIQELAPRIGHEPDSIEIVEIGSKPGEKLYEELMSDEETRRAIELRDYFAVLPAFRGMYRDIEYDYKDVVSTSVENPYISRDEACMDKEELRTFLSEQNLLMIRDGDRMPDKRYWPGDKE